MQAGPMDRRVVLQTASASTDSYGQGVQSYTDLATVWANVRYLTGRELLLAQQTTPNAQVKFQIRYRSDIDETSRIVHDGATYDIQHIAVIGRNVGLEILAVKP